MPEPLLVATDVVRHFGGVKAVDGVSLSVVPGQVTGLIGPNGAGKTTLVNVLTGLVPPQSGQVLLDGAEVGGLPAHKVARLGVARTFQNIRLYKGLTALENVVAGQHLHRRNDFLSVLVPGGWRRAGTALAEREGRARALLETVGLPAGIASREAGTLAYGDQRRLEIARALATGPRVLVLDEPAAGMNPTEKARLSELLASLADDGLAVLLIEHDIKLVMRLCAEIVVLDFGRRIAAGPPATVAEDPSVIAAYLGTKAAAQTSSVAVKEVADVGLAGAAPSGSDSAAPPILTVNGLEVAYGGIEALQGVSLSVAPGEVVALIGANGAGKSTLLRALSGLLRPKAGTAVFDGLNLVKASSSAIVRAGLVQVPEGREVLAAQTVRENLALGAYVRRDKAAVADEIEARLERFPLLANRADSPGGLLSGGEQQLLAIARALLAKPRLLALDEPSLGLAPRMAEQIFELIAGIAAEGMTVLLVEQNALAALELASRAYVLETGRVVQAGAAAALRDDPAVRAAYLGT